eukprot:SM000090S24325  [mRNA]  locus=s90:281414:283084:- [translate_table: standard]
MSAPDATAAAAAAAGASRRYSTTAARSGVAAGSAATTSASSLPSLELWAALQTADAASVPADVPVGGTHGRSRPLLPPRQRQGEAPLLQQRLAPYSRPSLRTHASPQTEKLALMLASRPSLWPLPVPAAGGVTSAPNTHLVPVTESRDGVPGPPQGKLATPTTPSSTKPLDVNERRTCQRKGCGIKFWELDNHDTACSYHPGPAVFHDRQRGWSCCRVTVKDFDEFLSIPPCARGWHSAMPDA